jgi:crossover junction endodeoxyribonuclease RuvC
MSQDLNPRTRIIAIDPGVNGAYAFLGFEGEITSTGELPRFDKLVDGVSLAGLLRSYRPETAVIEKVGSMPGQGVSSTFTFGCAYGVCIGAVCAFGSPLAYVTPAKWKGHFRLNGKPKDASRELAIRLYPYAAEQLTLKKHHGRADAILLARYAMDMDAGSKFA